MKADYCVDYLSYQWLSTDDLLETYKETCKQQHKKKKNVVNNNKEDIKLIRFQNALWRSMSVGRLIDPSTVCWQKESDITWLYGPMYINSSSSSASSASSSLSSSNCITPTATQNRLQVLKPVLKKSNVTQPLLLLPNYSDCINMENQQYHYTRNNSFSSVSSSSSTVHFNPEIIEIEYQPEYPIAYQQPEEEEEEEEDDDLFLQFIFYLNNISILNWFLFQNIFSPLFWLKLFNKRIKSIYFPS